MQTAFIVALIGLVIWLLVLLRRAHKRIRIQMDGYKGLQEMYADTAERLRSERQNYEEWIRDLYEVTQQYQSTIEDRNKTINQKREIASQLQAQVDAMKTIHLN